MPPKHNRFWFHKKKNHRPDFSLSDSSSSSNEDIPPDLRNDTDDEEDQYMMMPVGRNRAPTRRQLREAEARPQVVRDADGVGKVYYNLPWAFEPLPPDLTSDNDDDEHIPVGPNEAPPPAPPARVPPRRKGPPPPPRPNPPAKRPQIAAQARAYPLGNYRGANGVLSQRVSWAATLWLPADADDPNDPNFYVPPDPPQNPPPHAHLVFIRYQLERGDNGQVAFGEDRLHYQMALEFSEKVSALQVVEIMHWMGFPMDHIWLQPINGDRQNWLNYVWKDDTAVPNTRHEAGNLRPWNVAQVPQQIRTMVQAEADFNEIADAFPDYALRNATSIVRQITEFEKTATPLQRQVNAYCFWGDTGTGKSHAVWSSFPHANIYTKTTGKFFEGYQPKRQNILVIEEAPGDLTVEDLLKAVQGHPQIVEIKGGAVRARWDTVICTSNKPPSQWFPNMEIRHKEALLRRFNKGIIKFVDISSSSYPHKHNHELANAVFPQEHARVKLVDAKHLSELEQRQREEATRDREDPFAGW